MKSTASNYDGQNYGGGIVDTIHYGNRIIFWF